MIRVLTLAMAICLMINHSAAKTISGFDRSAFMSVHPGLTQQDIQKYVQTFRDNGVTGIIIGGGGHHYIYDTLSNLDAQIKVTKAVVEECHKYGIKVAEHHSNVLITDKNFKEAHKNWLMYSLDSEGQPTLWDGYATWAFCPNNPEFRAFYWNLLSDFVKKTGVDAVMSDDACFYCGCGCPVCQARWKKENGTDLFESYRKSKVAGSDAWRQWHETRRRWLLDYRVWLYKNMKKEFPTVENICLSNSSHAAWPTLVHGFYPEAGMETAEALCWEVYNPADFYSWRKIGVEASIFHEASRLRDVSVLCLPFADQAETLNQYDPQEEDFMWAHTKAFGLSFCHSRVYLNGMTPEDKPRKYFNFERDRLQPYLDSRITSPLGIMYSRRSRDTDPRWESSHVIPSVAWGQLCLSNALPYRAITEETLSQNQLKGIDVLVLPNVFSLSDRNLKAVEAFVKKGGTLVATYYTGTQDENGVPVYSKRRKSLERLFGVTLQVEEMTSEMTTEPVNSTPRTAQPLTLDGNIKGFENLYGKGKTYYFPSLLGSEFHQEYQNEGKPYADIKNQAQTAILAQWLQSLIPNPAVTFRIQSPGKSPLMTTHTLKKGQLLVHMVNTLGSYIADGTLIPTPSKVVWGEPQDVTLEFRTAPRKIRILSYTRKDDIVMENPPARVTIKTPEIYQLVVIDL